MSHTAKMASSHDGTYPCDLLQGLVPSCVPTLTPAATQEGLLAVFLCLAYLLLTRMRSCFLLFYYRDLMTAIGTELNMLVVVVRSAELASTSYLLGNYHTFITLPFVGCTIPTIKN